MSCKCLDSKPAPLCHTHTHTQSHHITQLKHQMLYVLFCPRLYPWQPHRPGPAFLPSSAPPDFKPEHLHRAKRTPSVSAGAWTQVQGSLVRFLFFFQSKREGFICTTTARKLACDLPPAISENPDHRRPPIRASPRDLKPRRATTRATRSSQSIRVPVPMFDNGPIRHSLSGSRLSRPSPSEPRLPRLPGRIHTEAYRSRDRERGEGSPRRSGPPNSALRKRLFISDSLRKCSATSPGACARGAEGSAREARRRTASSFSEVLTAGPVSDRTPVFDFTPWYT